MKFYIILVLFFLTSCIDESQPTDGGSANVQPPAKQSIDYDALFNPEGWNTQYSMHPVEISGMRYHIFYIKNNSDAGFKIVNITKDSLEVEKLKRPYQ